MLLDLLLEVLLEDLDLDLDLNDSNDINYTKLYKEYVKNTDYEVIQRNNFYYNLLYTLKKWGCNIIKFEYFEIKNEPKFIIDRQNINYSQLEALCKKEEVSMKDN